MMLLQRYVLRQLARPFLLGVCVVTFLLTMDFLFDYLDLFLGKGIALSAVLRLFGLSLGWILALSVPCGVLVGVLIAFGRMAQDNEIVAVRSSGIPVFRLILPALAASAMVAVLLALFHDRVLPDMNHAFANLMVAINKKRPTAEIREGVFISDFTGYNMFIGSLDDRSGRMEDILIYDSSRRDAPPRTILARRGRLEFEEVSATLRLFLEKGEIHEAGASGDGIYRRMDFAHQTLHIQGVQAALDRTQQRQRGQREMSIADMRRHIADLEAERSQYAERSRRMIDQLGLAAAGELPGLRSRPPWYAMLAGWLIGARPVEAPPDTSWTPARRRQAEEAKVAWLQEQAAVKKIHQYEVEIHKKFAIPFACIVFVLVGAPLGMRARRGGLAAGFLSAGFFMFYYLCLIGGEQLADRGQMPPMVAMWAANAILGALGVALTLRVCEVWRPRGAPGRARRSAA